MSHHSLDFIKENISAVHMKQWWEAESITGSRGIVSCALTQILGSVYLKENFLLRLRKGWRKWRKTDKISCIFNLFTN
jgi:hypothetical protein